MLLFEDDFKLLILEDNTPKVIFKDDSKKLILDVFVLDIFNAIDYVLDFPLA